jgi:16S rRNA (guanine966-N2)-methyltransferase
VRIIGGEYKSRRITPPGSLPVRPTTDMAREALFNLLVNRKEVEDASVIDLFSGTGFVSYEFCSRGAGLVTAVEHHRGAAAFIRNTAELLGMSHLHVIQGDVFRFIAHTPLKADIIFADPPYDMDGVKELPLLIFEAGLLLPDGLLIIEHGQSVSFSKHPNFKEVRNYGKVHFSFFRQKE